ncbi:MAG: 4a-hydroxytetrahydrobiopterin dehydratase [Gammaproteobacteria bacterium]|nr:4a-hydroxytetrahydrobiopterin dehydratase [Gammaproteobacteria bacterium]
MRDLAAAKCIPCTRDTPPLTAGEIEPLLAQLNSDWRVVDAHHLEREYRLKNFADALAFTNQVGEIAEAEFHHPDIFLAWGRVKVTIWTHKINGLSEADFVFSAKCDRAFETATPSES